MNNNQGMSLVEMLVFLGVMGVIMAGFAGFFTNLNRQGSRLDFKQASQGVTAIAEVLIQNATNCGIPAADLDFTTDFISSNTPKNISVGLKPDNATTYIFEVDKPFGKAIVKKIQLVPVDTRDTGTFTYEPLGTNVFLASLQITLERENDQKVKESRVAETPVILRKPANAAIDNTFTCAQGSGTSDTDKAAICGMFGGTYADDTCTLPSDTGADFSHLDVSEAPVGNIQPTSPSFP